MQALPLLQVDAFTDTIFGGNPCAVVFDADELSARTMQQIARELNHSETAFVMASEHADFRARYFTPGEEIPLAGHPTIATVHGLLANNRVSMTRNRCQLSLELMAGIVDIEVARGPESRPLITMTQPRPDFMRAYEVEEVAGAFSLPVDAIRDDLPIVTVSTGTPQLMVPVTSHDALRRARLRPHDYDELRAFGDFFSAHLFTPEGVTDAGDTFARHFGVPPDWREDSFTGSATGGMGAYLWAYGLLRHPRFVAEQGHWMDRPGYAEVEILGDRDDIHGVRVSGRAVEVMQGMFIIPEQP
jgi:trans-2,3-dihydro-3-hydroxyanthranilate isomerase